ncbi:MAG TPA: hypothetical protein VKK79_15130, partial [Candidatus Lokiarchaeia archaeon]|nr:hypothetical protein [Candidatus Lokiarchaeia archaeon]
LINHPFVFLNYVVFETRQQVFVEKFDIGQRALGWASHNPRHLVVFPVNKGQNEHLPRELLPLQLKSLRHQVDHETELGSKYPKHLQIVFKHSLELV